MSLLEKEGGPRSGGRLSTGVNDFYSETDTIMDDNPSDACGATSPFQGETFRYTAEAISHVSKKLTLRPVQEEFSGILVSDACIKYKPMRVPP